MGKHVHEEASTDTSTRDSQPQPTVKVVSVSILEGMGIIKDNVDASKYIYASDEVSKFMSEHGYKYVAKLLAPFATYNVFVVDHIYVQGSEDDYAKIFATLKKWSEYNITTFSRLILDNEELLKKLGVPISHFIYLLSGVEGKTRLLEGSEEKVEVAGGVQAVATASAKIEKFEKHVVEKEVAANLQTIRTALTFVLENVKKPTVLVLDSKEVELLGANTILKATMASKNLVVLVYDAPGGGEELMNLLKSGRAITFASGFPPAIVKSELINMCLALSRELSPKLLDIRGRKGTRAGVSATIKLLSEADILGKVAGYFIKRLTNPYVAFNAMATFIAKMYARFVRSPESVLDAYSNYTQRMKRAFSYALLRESFKTAGEVMKEVSQKFYRNE